MERQTLRFAAGTTQERLDMGQQSYRFEVEGLNDLLKMLNQGSREFTKELRKASRRIVGPVAEEAQYNALKTGRPQMIALSDTIRAKSDRVPVVAAIAARKVTSSNARAGDFFRGANFGDNDGRFKQFPRPIPGGSSIYPAIRAQDESIKDEFYEAMNVLWLKHYNKPMTGKD